MLARNYEENGEANLFGTLSNITCLKWCARALIWFELIEEDGIILAVRDIAAEVVHPEMTSHTYSTTVFLVQLTGVSTQRPSSGS